MNKNLTYKKIIETINQANNILVVIHVAPDGDAAGTACAFLDHLAGLGKSYDAYCQDEPDLNLRFLPKSHQFKNEIKNFDDYDLILTLDCADSTRTGLPKKILRQRPEGAQLINIDHHISNDYFGDINLIDINSSSTAEIVYDIFQAARVGITKNMAQCLLAGVVYDTGNFTNPATSNNSLRVASELMIRGAKLPQILENLYRTKKLPALKLWGRILSDLHYNFELDMAVSVVTLGHVEELGLAEEIIEGMANFLNNTLSTKIVLVLREHDNGTIKGSLRTNHDDTDVRKIAEVFGGGGHVKAAGFQIQGQLQREGERWLVV